MKESIAEALAVLRHDKRKLAMVVALLALGLLLWGRLMLKQVPRTAVAKPAKALAADAAPVRAVARRVVAVDLNDSLTRDPFQLDSTLYPRVEKPDGAQAAAKSEVKATDEKPDAVFLVKQAALGLSLQTTIQGDTPRALINGQLLAPGDTIRGFELKAVMSREVILEMNGIALRLEM